MLGFFKKRRGNLMLLSKRQQDCCRLNYPWETPRIIPNSIKDWVANLAEDTSLVFVMPLYNRQV